MIEIQGIIGFSANREVFQGFAKASLLHELSFSDVLDEATGKGYQRRFNEKHSLDFRRYIHQADSTTIPLTFNLRPSEEVSWTLVRNDSGLSVLKIDPAIPRILSRVDCQHRLGFLSDSEVPLPFMMYLGLSLREEMGVFNIINGKAKGLSASLLDYHEAKLASDVAIERPELFIALQLHEDPESPWHNQLDLGGKRTSGLKRRASLRTMQKAVKRFLSQTKALDHISPEEAVSVVIGFWCAVSVVLETQWAAPRNHLITKGIGVYALMGIAGDLFKEAEGDPGRCDKAYMCEKLSDFIPYLDWSNQGIFKALGGESGASEALSILRHTRRTHTLRNVRPTG